MDYGVFNDKIYVRIDKGEEILAALEKLCYELGVDVAYVSAIGATNDFTVGLFNTAEKKYYSNTFTGDHEIVSLTGTVTTKRGDFYAHLHMCAADAEGKVVGGHLNRAVVSATCEMVIFRTGGIIRREFDEETGLNLLKFY